MTVGALQQFRFGIISFFYHAENLYGRTPIFASLISIMKLNDFLKTKRSTIAEPACGSCSELPIELVDHYFLELVNRPL
jgi:hypothetical protein